ncbi:hypothetical protein GCM10023232_06630 [Sphingosinicella ginsenosidimutans]
MRNGQRRELKRPEHEDHRDRHAPEESGTGAAIGAAHIQDGWNNRSFGVLQGSFGRAADVCCGHYVVHDLALFAPSADNLLGAFEGVKGGEDEREKVDEEPDHAARRARGQAREARAVLRS